MNVPTRLLLRRFGGPDGIFHQHTTHSSTPFTGTLSPVDDKETMSPELPTIAPEDKLIWYVDKDDQLPESEMENNGQDDDAFTCRKAAMARLLAECEAMGVFPELAKSVERESKDFGNKCKKSFQGTDEPCEGEQKKQGGRKGGTDFPPCVKCSADQRRSGSVGSTADATADDNIVPRPLPTLGGRIAADGESISTLLRSSKSEVLMSLSSSHGDTTSPRFLSSINALSSIFYRDSSGGSTSSSKCSKSIDELFEGSWHTLSKPNFKECLGRNSKGDFMYTLGRMSFGMFRPTALRCSVQKIMCSSRRVGSEEDFPNEVPKALKEEVFALLGGDGILRTYDIEVHFTIEPRSPADNKDECGEGYRAPTKPIKAVMTNYGYALPDPHDWRRFTVWFTGGIMAPVPENENNKSSSKIKKIFSSSCSNSSTEGNDNACTLSLCECRRKNKSCSLHGLKHPTREKRQSMQLSSARSARPRYGRSSCSSILSSRLGTMAMPYSMEWEDIFAPADNWKRSVGERAQALTARVMLGAEVPTGMDDDGTISFVLNRPIGGHGVAFVDILYLDEDMRITRGNLGAIFVQLRDGSRLHQLSTKKLVVPEKKPSSQREAACSARRSIPTITHLRDKKAIAA